MSGNSDCGSLFPQLVVLTESGCDCGIPLAATERWAVAGASAASFGRRSGTGDQTLRCQPFERRLFGPPRVNAPGSRPWFTPLELGAEALCWAGRCAIPSGFRCNHLF